MRCPHCKFKNRDGVKFCEECGEGLPKPSGTICLQCGFENREGVQFCEECGNRLLAPGTSICPECGFENRDGVRFCEECGASFSSEPDYQPPAPPPVPAQQPVVVTIQNQPKKQTWAWVVVGGLFIVFAFLFVTVLWPSLSTMRFSLNNNSHQSNSVPAVDNSGPAPSNSNEVPQSKAASSEQQESVQASSQQSSQADEPVLIEEETNCNHSKYVRETIPDHTVFQPGEAFQKTWTVRNEGDCTWNTGYTFEHTQGAYLDGATKINMPEVVEPGEEVTLSLDMRAPDEPGTYTGRWEIFSDDGEVLGWYSVVIDVVGVGSNTSFAVSSVNLYFTKEGGTDNICADITSTAPGKVTFTWEDDAGAQKTGSLDFQSAGTKTHCVYDINLVGWAKLYIDEPNHQWFGPVFAP